MKLCRNLHFPKNVLVSIKCRKFPGNAFPTSLFPIFLSPGSSYMSAFLPSSFGATKSPCCESALIVSRPFGLEVMLLENIFVGAGELWSYRTSFVFPEQVWKSWLFYTDLYCEWLCFPYFPLFLHGKLQKGEMCFVERFTSFYNSVDSRKLSFCRGMWSTGQQFFHPLHRSCSWQIHFHPKPSRLLLFLCFSSPYSLTPGLLHLLPHPGHTLPAVPGSTNLGVSQPYLQPNLFV